MTEIQLPCCETIARVETLAEPIRCERCGIELELADDEPLPDRVAA